MSKNKTIPRQITIEDLQLVMVRRKQKFCQHEFFTFAQYDFENDTVYNQTVCLLCNYFQ